MHWILRMLFLFSALIVNLGTSYAKAPNPHAAFTMVDPSSDLSSDPCVGITNANSFIFVLSSYSPGGAYCINGCGGSGASCYPTLASNGSQAIDIPSGTWLYLQYSVCSSVTYDDQGSAICGGYIGSVGLTFSGSSVAISDVNGGTASIGTPSGGYYPITFTPSAPTTFGMQNTNTDSYYVFTGSTQDSGSSCNGSCYATLSPNAQQFVSVSPGGYIDLEYQVCDTVTYSDEGAASCATCENLGSFGITFTSSGASVSNSYNGTVNLTALSTTLSGVNFSSTSSPCPLGSTIPTPQVYDSIPYRGVNLAGCDFATFYPPCACDAVYFVNQGASIVRLPVLWEYLQPGLTPSSAPASIDFTTGDALVYANLVDSLTSSGLYVIIDMHNYMRYDAAAPGVYITGPDYIIGSGDPTALTVEQYVAAWQSIAEQFVDNPLVMFDLMNEPNDMSTYLIIQNYNAVIAAIRTVETNASVPPHLIHLEGNSYTCLGTWTTADPASGYDVANSVVFVPGSDPTNSIVDPSDNYVIHVHEYFTGDGSSSPTQACGSGTTTTCVPAADVLTIENFTAFTSYLQTNHLKAFIGELNGAANSNCAACVNNLLTGLETVPYSVGAGYGFLGWTGWAGGSFDTSYILNLTPTYSGSTETQTIQMLEGFNPHMTPL